MDRRSTFIAALAAGLLASCATTPPLDVDTSEYVVAVDGELPQPGVGDITSSVRPYVIGPYDKLNIDVFGIEGLMNRDVQADASGRISFPLAGTIDAAGLTPIELQREVTQRLREAYVRDPQVSVNLTEVRSQVVTVEGLVAEPGLYPVLGNMTLLKSIATAQGVGEYADENVVIFRNVGGTRYAAVYNLQAIRRGNYADPEVFGGDIVIVGEDAQKRRFDRVLAAGPALLSPLILLIR